MIRNVSQPVIPCEYESIIGDEHAVNIVEEDRFVHDRYLINAFTTSSNFNSAIPSFSASCTFSHNIAFLSCSLEGYSPFGLWRDLSSLVPNCPKQA